MIWVTLGGLAPISPSSEGPRAWHYRRLGEGAPDTKSSVLREKIHWKSISELKNCTSKRLGEVDTLSLPHPTPMCGSAFTNNGIWQRDRAILTLNWLDTGLMEELICNNRESSQIHYPQTGILCFSQFEGLGKILGVKFPTLRALFRKSWWFSKNWPIEM